MAQMLEVSRSGYKLSIEDEQILRSLEQGKLEIEQVLEQADVERSKALSSITSLIEAGYLQLVIITYPWGVEFLLQHARRDYAPQLGKAKLGTTRES